MGLFVKHRKICYGFYLSFDSWITSIKKQKYIQIYFHFRFFRVLFSSL